MSYVTSNLFLLPSGSIKNAYADYKDDVVRGITQVRHRACDIIIIIYKDTSARLLSSRFSYSQHCSFEADARLYDSINLALLETTPTSGNANAHGP